VAAAAVLGALAVLPAVSGGDVPDAAAGAAAPAAPRALPAVPGTTTAAGSHLRPAGPLAARLDRATATAAATSYDVVDDVSCLQPGNCLAVGENYDGGKGYGSPLAYLWNGSTWTASSVPLPAGATGGFLLSVSCQPGGCLAVGSYARYSVSYPLAEFWNGSTWTSAPQPADPSGAAFVNLEGVSCFSLANCVAVGGYAAASNTSNQYAFAEVWNGSTWRVSPAYVPTGKYAYSNLDSASCTAANSCLLGGVYRSAAGNGVAWVEHFDGAHWRLVTTPAPTPAAGYFDYVNSISCSSATSCAAVGESGKTGSAFGAFTEVLSGTAWKLAPVPGWPAGQDTTLATVTCLSATQCIAAGGYGTYRYWTTGTAAIATWNGAAWALTLLAPASGQGNVLLSVTCTSASACLAVGGSGTYNTAAASGLSASFGGTSWLLGGTF
jgi:hypothetical protein